MIFSSGVFKMVSLPFLCMVAGCGVGWRVAVLGAGITKIKKVNTINIIYINDLVHQIADKSRSKLDDFVVLNKVK